MSIFYKLFNSRIYYNKDSVIFSFIFIKCKQIIFDIKINLKSYLLLLYRINKLSKVFNFSIAYKLSLFSSNPCIILLSFIISFDLYD